jgi:hypothetical protein
MTPSDRLVQRHFRFSLPEQQPPLQLELPDFLCS